MLIPNSPSIFPMPFAANGDVNAIPQETPSGTGQFSFSAGFPAIPSLPLVAGGLAPTREDFNAALKLLSEHLFFLQSGGIYPWVGATVDFPGLNYLPGYRVMGSDGNEYKAIKASGPDIVSDSGAVGPKDPTTDTAGFWRNASIVQKQYDLCTMVYPFIHPDVQPGMIPVIGTLVANAPTLHPMAFYYLQTPEGQKMCVSEAEWQAARQAVWAMLADGTPIGWENIGGICKYVLDANAGTIRVPDLRGMGAEIAGFDSLGVAGVHGDMSRRLYGKVIPTSATATGNAPVAAFSDAEGVFALEGEGVFMNSLLSRASTLGTTFILDSENAVPTGNANKIRSYGVNGCVWFGTAS